MTGILVVYLIVMVLLYIVPMWLIFAKAGQPGWAAIVPIYNIYVMTQVARKPGWWVAIILLVPIANFVFLIMTYHGISVNFGKGAGFTIGLILLPIIFLPILGYGSAKYITNPATPAA